MPRTAVILDTNAFSALADGEPAIEPVLREARQAAVPVIVLGEYRFGIMQSRNHLRYEAWLSDYLPRFLLLKITERTTYFFTPSCAKNSRD